MSRRSGRVPKPRRRFIEEGDTAVDVGAEEEEDAGSPLSSSFERPCERPSNGHAVVRGRSRVRHGRSVEGRDARSRSPIRPAPVAWKSAEEPDVAPEKLPFCPRREPGVQPPLNTGRPTPLEIFECFWDAEVLRLLCRNTNKNAARLQARGRKYRWKDVTEAELKVFIALLLCMPMVNTPKQTDLWRKGTIYDVAFPCTTMSRDRFKMILASIHISDPEDDVRNEQRRGKADYDVVHRVRPLMELMRTRCMAVYHPRKHISVDERMVATKARLSIKQYMKDKPTKWGLKYFVLADNNGYTVDFRLYSGRAEVSSGHGLTFDVVNSLVRKEWLGTGYIVYCDNYYTSPLLFNHLSQEGFGACGTYRQGRIGVPKTEENALTKKSPRGSIRWIREGRLLFVKWMDTREVSLCSSVHSVDGGEMVLRWGGKKRDDGSLGQVSIPRPTVVGEYNKYMGGVDISDQLLGTNSTRRSTKRWYMTVFRHMLDLAVTNSFVISRDLADARKEKHPTRQQFHQKLVDQLFGDLATPQPPRPVLRRADLHTPVVINTAQVDKSQRASMGRRRCHLCHRSTPWHCKACLLPLCLTMTRNCHDVYHEGLLPDEAQV